METFEDALRSYGLTSENYLSGDPTAAYEAAYGRCRCKHCTPDKTRQEQSGAVLEAVRASHDEAGIHIWPNNEAQASQLPTDIYNFPKG